MSEFYTAPLDDCPPTVLLARVAYRIIVYTYKVNPLSFRPPDAGIRRTAGLLRLDGFDALADTCISAAEYCTRFDRNLLTWRRDVERRAGKAKARRADPRWRASDRSYPRVTNRGVAPPCSWLEDLPSDLLTIAERCGQAS